MCQRAILSSLYKIDTHGNDPKLALRQVGKFYLFDSDSFASAHIQSPEDRTKCSLSKAVAKLLHCVSDHTLSRCVPGD